MKKYARYQIAGMVGNILEHYDSALFGLLAPCLAPLFFQQDPLTALIMTYGIIPLGLITRPLGALFFGRIGDIYGRKQALSLSLLGMAVATVGIGMLPTYNEVGCWAPIGLACMRMLQSFCAAGESAGGAIFVLEHTRLQTRSIMSSLYDASTVSGILLASALVTILSVIGKAECLWRGLFFAGAFTAVMGVIIRCSIDESHLLPVNKKNGIQTILRSHLKPFIAIICCSGFGHITYSLAFVLMNGYIPLVTSLTQADVMQINTYLLVIDMLALPCFGYIASRVGKEKVMITASLFSAICAIPLFQCLDQASMATVVGVRLLLVTVGVAFAAPYYAWAIDRVLPAHRYTVLSLGSALGSQLIGAPTSAVSLWLYQETGWMGVPGAYLLVFGLLAAYAVWKTAPQKTACAAVSAG